MRHEKCSLVRTLEMQMLLSVSIHAFCYHFQFSYVGIPINIEHAVILRSLLKLIHIIVAFTPKEIEISYANKSISAFPSSSGVV